MPGKPKLFFITTIDRSLVFFKGQITYLKKAFDIHLVTTPGKKLKEYSEAESVKAYPLSMVREIAPLRDFMALFKFINLFLKEKPDIIHCNTPKGAFLSLVAGFITGISHRIYFVHGLRYQGAAGFKKTLLIFLEKLSCFCATDIIAVSNGVRKVLNKEVTGKPIKLIGYGSVNGIDLSLFNKSNYNNKKVRQKINIADNDFIFGFMGRLVRDKGVNELVNSFKRLSSEYENIKLVLMGRFEEKLDPLKEETLKEIQDNKNITFISFQNDVKPYLAVFDILTFPSYREGFGMSLMEANAMRVPAISSNITGCNEIIIDKVNGLLIEPKNETDLYNKMEYCLLNKEEVAEMSLNCREIIDSKFSQAFVWSNSLKMYKKIVKS